MSQKMRFLTYVLRYNPVLVYKFVYLGSNTTYIIKNINNIRIFV